MLDILLRPAVLVPTALVIGYLIYYLFFKLSKLPKLPIIGAKEGDWFPILQARWRNTKDFKAAVKYAYKYYKDATVIVPVGGQTLVMLPPTETQFVIDQPDDVLNMHEQVTRNLQIDYTVKDPKLVHNPVHHKLLTTTLTNQIGNLVPDVADETAWSFSKHWGIDIGSFREVCVYDSIRRILGNVSNRVFVGYPLCRDTVLLDNGIAYAQDVPIGAELLNLIPAPLRPLAALVITIPNRIHTRAFFRQIYPEIDRRLKEFDARTADPESKASLGPVPNDFLQWNIAQAKASGDPYMWQHDTLAGRVLLLNMAAVHTSSFSLTAALLDMVTSKPEYIEELRDEIREQLTAHGGGGDSESVQWNKRALAKMEKLDSFLRESMRLNSFVTVGLARRVMAKKGLTTPSGVHIPYGTRVVVPSYPVLHDDAVYPDADTFKPFRFAEQRREEGVEYVQRARKAFATTSNDYLAFGHGRNACPGRFFAANELKLMLGHAIMNYDFEMQETRPGSQWFGLNRIPPMKATIKIRRREKA